MPRPKKTKKLIPVVPDDELGALLATWSGKSFRGRRDTAIIRLLLDTGGRLTETTMVDVDDVTLRRDLIKVHGEGDKERSIPFGEKTGQALTRYLRVRAKDPGMDLPALFLSERGRKRLGRDGVKTMLRRRGEEAGIAHVHAHKSTRPARAPRATAGMPVPGSPNRQSWAPRSLFRTAPNEQLSRRGWGRSSRLNGGRPGQAG